MRILVTGGAGFIVKKANEFLGWEPKVNLEQGLDKTIEYFKRQLITP